MVATTTAIQDAIDRYSDLIAHVAWRIVHDREETRDICQETFLRFCAEGVEGQKIDYPKAWLCRTALNLAIDVARRRNQVQKHLEHPLTADLSVPGREHIDRALLVERVRILALRLPERQREVFLLRNFEDLSYAEIGSLVDCTPETARVNEYHAVQKIRVWLHVDQEDWEGEADDTGNV